MKTPQVTTYLTVEDSFTPKIRIMTKLSAFDTSFQCKRFQPGQLDNKMHPNRKVGFSKLEKTVFTYK